MYYQINLIDNSVEYVTEHECYEPLFDFTQCLTSDVVTNGQLELFT